MSKNKVILLFDLTTNLNLKRINFIIIIIQSTFLTKILSKKHSINV